MGKATQRNATHEHKHKPSSMVLYVQYHFYGTTARTTPSAKTYRTRTTNDRTKKSKEKKSIGDGHPHPFFKRKNGSFLLLDRVPYRFLVPYAMECRENENQINPLMRLAICRNVKEQEVESPYLHHLPQLPFLINNHCHQQSLSFALFRSVINSIIDCY